jgi:hypothetical protein
LTGSGGRSIKKSIFLYPQEEGDYLNNYGFD